MPTEKLPTISNIAERLQLQHHSTVELINRLEEHALVERHRDELDQRRVLIQITPQGEEVLQELSSHNLEELQTAAPLLVRSLNALIKESNLSATKYNCRGRFICSVHGADKSAVGAITATLLETTHMLEKDSTKEENIADIPHEKAPRSG